MSDTTRMPPDHERMQEMPLQPPKLQAWAALYEEREQPAAPVTSLSPARHGSAASRPQPATTSSTCPAHPAHDPLQAHIRQTELLCAELDRLRSAALFANAELTELLHVLSVERYDEERHGWQGQFAQRKQQQANTEANKETGTEAEAEKEKETETKRGAVSYRPALPTDIPALDAFARMSFRHTFFEACAYTEADLQQCVLCVCVCVRVCVCVYVCVLLFLALTLHLPPRLRPPTRCTAALQLLRRDVPAAALAGIAL